MTPVALLRAARADIRRAARFYGEESVQLSGEFVQEVTRALDRLGENPETGAPMRRNSRKLLVRRFPYLVIYREADRVLCSRSAISGSNPDFWLSRA